MAVVEITKLAKQYGRIEALKGVSLKVEKKEIFGLLGQNGAGKTTMIKILLGITKITDGEALLLGEPVGTAAGARRSATCRKTIASPIIIPVTACWSITAPCWSCRGGNA